jgi:hypothetical protein
VIPLLFFFVFIPRHARNAAREREAGLSNADDPSLSGRVTQAITNRSPACTDENLLNCESKKPRREIESPASLFLGLRYGFDCASLRSE